MRNQIVLTEQGEGQVTVPLLFDVLANCVHHAFACDDFDSPTCVYICSTLNLLGSQGLIEIRPIGKPPSSKSDVDTSKPPSFISDAFRTGEEGKGDAKAD